jgi:hypothetical protein
VNSPELETLLAGGSTTYRLLNAQTKEMIFAPIANTTGSDPHGGAECGRTTHTG